jgi:hypothetical protein
MLQHKADLHLWAVCGMTAPRSLPRAPMDTRNWRFSHTKCFLEPLAIVLRSESLTFFLYSYAGCINPRGRSPSTQLKKKSFPFFRDQVLCDDELAELFGIHQPP